MEASALLESWALCEFGVNPRQHAALDCRPGCSATRALCIPASHPAVLDRDIPTPITGRAVRRAMRAAVDSDPKIVGSWRTWSGGSEFTGTAVPYDLAKEFAGQWSRVFPAPDGRHLVRPRDPPVKFLCVDCDQSMLSSGESCQRRNVSANIQVPNVPAAWSRPAHEPDGTHLVRPVGVVIGGKTVPAQPLKRSARWSATGRDMHSRKDGGGARGRYRPPVSCERASACPLPLRSRHGKKIYLRTYRRLRQRSAASARSRQRDGPARA